MLFASAASGDVKYVVDNIIATGNVMESFLGYGGGVCLWATTPVTSAGARCLSTASLHVAVADCVCHVVLGRINHYVGDEQHAGEQHRRIWGGTVRARVLVRIWRIERHRARHRHRRKQRNETCVFRTTINRNDRYSRSEQLTTALPARAPIVQTAAESRFTQMCMARRRRRS